MRGSATISSINIASMTERYERNFVQPDVELVDDPVISHAKSKFIAPLQSLVRKIFQTPAQNTNLFHYAGTYFEREPLE